MTPSGSSRQWPKDGEAESPFKSGRNAAIREIRPNGDSPRAIKIDLGHTYAIAGIGKDDLASCLVFLSVRCAIFGVDKWEMQLEFAFEKFAEWCYANKKTSTITEFSKKSLKMTSLLV